MKFTQALRYWGEGEGGRFGNNGKIQVIIRFNRNVSPENLLKDGCDYWKIGFDISMKQFLTHKLEYGDFVCW